MTRPDIEVLEVHHVEVFAGRSVLPIILARRAATVADRQGLVPVRPPELEDRERHSGDLDRYVFRVLTRPLEPAEL